MAVTQFVSVLLYTAVFVTIVMNANFAETGFGGIPRDQFDRFKAPEERGTLFLIQLLVLGSIVALNAIRYHLSFWSVEENEGFKKLCAWARDHQLRHYIRGDLSLRILSYVILFLLQLSCATNGGRPEFFLVLLFALLVVWDLLVLRIAYEKERSAAVATPQASAAPASGAAKRGLKVFWQWLRHDCKCAVWLKRGNTFWQWMKTRESGAGVDAEIMSFKIDVCRWLVAETIVLVCGIVYVIWAALAAPSMGAIQTAMLLTFLGLVSLGLAVWDIFVANRAKYKPILFILVVLVGVLVLVLRVLGLDQHTLVAEPPSEAEEKPIEAPG